MAQFLVCYDIADPRRLGRVHRLVTKRAMFVQLSVYFLQGDRADLMTLMNELKEVIDEDQDDVRAYTVRSLADAMRVGCSWLPDGIHLPK